jgi:hypothetical protein
MGLLTNNRSKTNSVYSQVPVVTPRKTPRDLMMATGNGESTTKKKSGAGFGFKVPTFDKFLAGNKAQLLTEKKDGDEKIKRDEEAQRERDMEELKRNSNSSFKAVIMPQYTMNERLKVY